MDNKENLFIYGTLKEAEVQKKVFGRATKGITDALIGYKKSTVVLDKKVYPTIVPDPKSIIDGLVIAITPEELELIDKYETEAYKKIRATLKSGEKAWAYIKN